MKKLTEYKRVDIAKHPEFYGTLSENNKGDWLIVPFETAEQRDRLDATKDKAIEAAIALTDNLDPALTVQNSPDSKAGKFFRALAGLDILKAVQDAN